MYALELFLNFFERIDYLVAPSIEFGIFFLILGMCEDIVNTFAYTFFKSGGSLIARDGSFQLSAIEHYRCGFVANEIAFDVVLLWCNIVEVGRLYIIRFKGHAKCIGHGFVDLIPCERFV